MNAQKHWKMNYRMFRRDLASGFDLFASADHDNMHTIRREAALERRCEALERQNKAQAQRIEELESESNEAWRNPFLLSGDELDRAERQLRSR